MSQSALTDLISECRAAYQAGSSKDEYLVKESLQHAFRLKMKVGALEQEIQDRHTALDAELESIREEIKQLNEVKDRIIQEHVNTGVLEESGYKIDPKVQKTNRKPDMDKIRAQKDDWDLLIQLEVKRVKDNYVPNQNSLKAVFGKRFESFLTPAQTTILGYDIVPIAEIPEKAGEVEV